MGSCLDLQNLPHELLATKGTNRKRVLNNSYSDDFKPTDQRNNCNKCFAISRNRTYEYGTCKIWRDRHWFGNKEKTMCFCNLFKYFSMFKFLFLMKDN